MTHPGWESAKNHSLWEAITQRRTRRVSLGVKQVAAGPLTYESNKEPVPLTELEEAILISVTGATGLTMPDRPYQDEDGNPIQASPNLHLLGRTAGSPDNAQATHFFLINDEGTYLLRKLDRQLPVDRVTPELLIERAKQSKIQVSPDRLSFPREFPYYLDSNRFLSNLKGSTILMPIVDMTWQYINGLMYLLTQEDGKRPTIVDDRNFYLTAGVRKWVKRGFLNKDIKLPLGTLGTLRTHIEADLLLQNIMLMTEAIGLGGWIHASYAGPLFMGHPRYKKYGKGLGFRYHVPKHKLLSFPRWGTFLRDVRANPVGLDGILEGNCPPYRSIDESIDAVIDSKYGKQGIYKDVETFKQIFADSEDAKQYVSQVPQYSEETVQCVRDICHYIYKTHGRFPAHVDAMHVPGIWLQAHHLDLEYYDGLFQTPVSKSHRTNEELWRSVKGESPKAE